MIFKAIILGIIEGLTEFLPISSTGHLIIVNKFIEFNGEFAILFDIFIQIGAIFAVLIYFRKKIFPENLEKNNLIDYFNLWLKVFIAFIPAVISGILLSDFIEKYLFNIKTVSIALFIGAILLFLSEKFFNQPEVTNEKNINFFHAIIIGLFQCLSLFPGMSRSASSIIGGLFMKFNKETSVNFSFYLAIPTIIGASLYKLIKTNFALSNLDILILIIGTLTSFIVAFIVIVFFMNYIKKRSFLPFVIYRILLGFLLLLL